MKKLRVILPAILTLAVSTSAAVTGTVAWFTATRLKTVTMTGITVVNPEQGLKLVKVENVANVKLTNVNNDGTPKDGETPEITHLQAKVSESWEDLYLRDASYNIGTGTVYRAELDEKTGDIKAIDPFKPATVGDGAIRYVDANNKTFKGNKVVYATQYTLSFQSTTNTADEDTFENRLFLDIGASTFSIKNNTNANPELNKALRVAFKSDGEGADAFVWAPFADGFYRDYSITQGNFEDKKSGLKVKNGNDYADATAWANNTPYYRAIDSYTYVNGTAKDAKAVYKVATGLNDITADTNFIVGEIGEDESTLLEEGNDGNITNDNGTKYIGHLGTLSTASRVITVTTWFEGTDPNCINDNFGGSLDNIGAELKFVMRRVTK